MRSLKLFTPVIAAGLCTAPLMAEQITAPEYRDSIRCAVINTVFSGTEEDKNSDAAKSYENLGTAWLVHALLTGGKTQDATNGDFDEALRSLKAKLEDDGTAEEFLYSQALKCVELEITHADLLSKYAEE